MKKLLSCLLAVAMLLSLMTFTVSAAEMPTTIEAPGSIVLSETVLNGACIQVTYNKGADLSELVTLGTAAREKYGISQRELTAILGFGKMTINRYERGGVPTKSQSDYIKVLIENEKEFIKKAK